MAKVCLVRPPSIVSPVAYIASLTPPIGLAYIHAVLEEAGHEVVLIDGVGEDPMQSNPAGEGLVARGLSFEQVVERIPQDTNVIGFSCMFSSEWVQLRELVNQISEAFPDPILIGGGEHFTAAPELSLEHCPGIDLIACGEGEETMLEVVNAVDAAGGNPPDFTAIDGLVIRAGQGDVVKTAPRKRIREIDTIPAPSWKTVPLQNYFDNDLTYGVNRGRSMPMLASRGCPYQCTFCSNPLMWTPKWMARDPKKVVDEIEEYIERYQIQNVDFYDLTAIVKKDWIVSFCKELVERGVEITWQLPSGTRSEAIDAEVAGWLYRSGCRNLNYAPESGSKTTLKNIRKKIKLSSMVRSLRSSVREGLNVKTNIIIGLPDETDWEIWKTLLFLVRMSWHGAHDVSIGVFAPYPGSTLYDRLVDEGVIDHSDAYWQKLAYVDISETVSYTKHVSSRRLRMYNWMGFALFYGSNYLFRPARFFRTLRNLKRNQHESRGEMALQALLTRVTDYRRKKKTTVEA